MPDDEIDLIQVIELYRAGGNVLETLGRRAGASKNSLDAIEAAYDLQAGCYIEVFNENPSYHHSYVAQLAGLIRDAFGKVGSVLDAGAGELTNTALLGREFGEARIWACDLSWSRLAKGRSFVEGTMPDVVSRMEIFGADIHRIPLEDNSVDVVVTMHALEPNGGREREILRELLRVARKGLVLVEPSWELSSDQQRSRMEAKGYVRGLPDAVLELGGELLGHNLLAVYSNPLNRSASYVVRKLDAESCPREAQFVDPVSKTELKRAESFLFSPKRGVVFPVIREIPILRESAQVLATALVEEPELQ